MQEDSQNNKVIYLPMNDIYLFAYMVIIIPFLAALMVPMSIIYDNPTFILAVTIMLWIIFFVLMIYWSQKNRSRIIFNHDKKILMKIKKGSKSLDIIELFLVLLCWSFTFSFID